MKKFVLVLSLLIMSISALAADRGEMYLGPSICYHFFDSDHDLDDKIEGGLRLGYFLTDSIAIEAEGDYTSTDHDTKGDTGVTSLSLSGVKFFDISEYYKPFLFLGAGGMLAEDDTAALVAGIGARVIANDNFSFDFRLKDMLHSKGGRNDIIPSVSLNFHFGKTAKAAAVKEKAEEKPKEEPKEEPAAEPAKIEKKEAAMAKAERTDSDNDGIYDDEDRCPATPAGYPVNSIGCTPDTDGDGVYDFEDRCPNTIKGVKVNSAGCFISVTLNINFMTNSAKVSPAYMKEIGEFADFLKANPPLKVEIQGHTDSKGEAEYNQRLSQRRAETVMGILVNKYGIKKSRLKAIGYGENRPLVPNDSAENMLKNRRIDTVVK